jgi:exopolyphosphatase / guanosine-5'-triphosphate,3'-diphosphate pyrophosphatase
MPTTKLQKKPFDRGIKTFIELLKIARKYKAESIHAFATSAVRSSLNGPEFVKRILEKTGIIVQVLNGDTEAQYIYKGVKLALDDLPQPILIMDIGGGSTEFIIASENQVLWKRSFDLGAARLIQKFQPSDPLTPEQEKNLKEHFRDMLKPLNTQLKKHQVNTLIGCSGSFESLADMIKAEKNDNLPWETFTIFITMISKVCTKNLLPVLKPKEKPCPD